MIKEKINDYTNYVNNYTNYKFNQYEHNESD